MNKATLIEKLAAAAAVSKRDAENMLDGLVKIIIEELKAAEVSNLVQNCLFWINSMCHLHIRHWVPLLAFAYNGFSLFNELKSAFKSLHYPNVVFVGSEI